MGVVKDGGHIHGDDEVKGEERQASASSCSGKEKKSPYLKTGLDQIQGSDKPSSLTTLCSPP